MRNKYGFILKGILVITILTIMGCPTQSPVTEPSPIPSATPSPVATGTPYISTTNVRGKILLPAGFQYYTSSTIGSPVQEKGKGFIVEAYNYNNQLYGRVGANEEGEYTFVSMPVGIRITFQAIYTRTNNVTLRAVADIHASQAGKETQVDITTRSTAVGLIIADSQSKNSNISKIPVSNFDIVPEFSISVTKVENNIVTALAKPVTQILTPVTADTKVIEEVKNAEVTIGVTLSQKPEWGSPPVGIMIGDSLPIISLTTPPASTSTATPAPIVTTTPTIINSYSISTLSISPGPTVVCANNSTIQFSVTAYNYSGQQVSITPSWSSSNISVGIINSSGLFQAFNTGGTTITATVGNITTSASVTVNSTYASSLTISPSSTTVGISGTVQFYAYGRDSGGSTVNITPVWIVGNSNIGTIDNQGRFTGRSSGTTIVTAISGNLTQTATITVGSGYALSISAVSPSLASSGTSITIYGNYFDSSTSNNNVYFNGTKATVTYASNSLLTVIVPYGATSGYIMIINTTYGGSAVSPTTFTVL